MNIVKKSGESGYVLKDYVKEEMILLEKKEGK
jgi:hypothetical protein